MSHFFEEFGRFFAVDHETVRRVLADQSSKSSFLEVARISIKALSILERHSCCPLHLTQTNGVNLGDQGLGDA